PPGAFKPLRCMRMGIDKTRSDIASVGIDFQFCGGASRNKANADDAVTNDTYIYLTPWSGSAVKNTAIADDNVVFIHRSNAKWRDQGSGQTNEHCRPGCPSGDSC